MNRDDLPDRFEDLSVSEQERVRLAGKQMGHLAFAHSAGIVIAPPPGSGNGRVNNGTGFVKLSGSYYLGTALHVVDSWINRTRDGERLLLQVGGADLPPGNRLAWKDEVADIAFIKIDAIDAERIGVLPYEPVLGWPPPMPTVGDFILLAGYPGSQREHPDSESIDLGCFSGLVSVISVHKHHLICQFQRQHWISHDVGELPPLRADLRVSGGPAMLVRNLAYPLVGVVVEHNSEFELMRISLFAHLPGMF
jgi:hypothetical protein